MSYNVDMWRTKELVDLRVPVASLFKHERTDWHPSREAEANGEITFSIFESRITGTVDDGILAVTSIVVYGEGSGVALDWIVEPALKDSTGVLVASRIWEGGDYIDLLTVRDGVLIAEAIDI